MRISRVGIAWIALAGVSGPALPGRARAAASAPAAGASQGDLPQLWRRLTTESPVEAEQTVRAMAKAGDRAVTFLAPRLEPSRADAQQIRRWIAELGSQKYAVRQEAFRGLASLGERGVLLGMVLATLVLTEMITNNAAAILMFPIAIAAAAGVGADPRGFAIAVALTASASFLTPIGYQTNTMVWGPGGYRFSDYSRLGIPLTVVAVAALVWLIPVFWPA